MLTPPRFRALFGFGFRLALLACAAASVHAQPMPDSSGGFSFFSPGGGASPTAAPAVRAELVADTAAVQPGRPFRLGVRLTMQPGWHTYWLNAGDAGEATRVDWRLPAGFTAGPLQWPLPERFETGGLISYGYEKQVLLFATVRPPASLAPASPLQFSAKVRWIACKEACIPGDAEVSLTIPTGPAAPSPAAAEFDRAAGEVPAQLAGSENDVMRIEFSPAPKAAAAGEQRIEARVLVKDPWRLDVRADSATSATTPALAPPPALFPLATGNWQTSHPTPLGHDHQGARFAWPVTWNADAQSTSSNLQSAMRLPMVNASSGERRLSRIVVEVPTEGGKGKNGKTGTDGTIPQSAIRNPQSSAPVFSFLDAPAGALPLWEVLLYAFLGGLILNVMPCVLPVLSLKVLGFVRQAGQERRRAWRLGLTYALGVLVSFAALAGAVIILQRAGAQVGQGFQLQEPRFVVIMTAVVFALGLSLLGVYTIELPGAAVNRIDQFGRREGYPGAFLSGVLSTALATPCSAPFLGSALGFAFTQPPAMVLLVFLVAALGLAAPYVLLSANPALLRFVPKPGKWLLVFEQLMGFVMIGFAVWLLWVLGRQAGAAGVVWTLAFLLAVAVACWLMGLVAASSPSRPRWTLALLAALVLTGGAFLLFPERYLRTLSREAPAAVSVAAAGRGAIDWEPFSVARVEQLVKDGRTVFVDFTADWCLTCKFNERTLETDRVRQLFRRHNVAALKADWTSRDETIGRVLRQFGASGVPLYVIFPAGRPERPRVLPTLISAELLEGELARAAAGSS